MFTLTFVFKETCSSIACVLKTHAHTNICSKTHVPMNILLYNVKKHAHFNNEFNSKQTLFDSPLQGVSHFVCFPDRLWFVYYTSSSKTGNFVNTIPTEIGYMNIIPRCLDCSGKYPIYENLPETYAAINAYLSTSPLEGGWKRRVYIRRW